MQRREEADDGLAAAQPATSSADGFWTRRIDVATARTARRSRRPSRRRRRTPGRGSRRRRRRRPRRGSRARPPCSLPSASGTRATRRSPAAVSLATPTFMGTTVHRTQWGGRAECTGGARPIRTHCKARGPCLRHAPRPRTPNAAAADAARRGQRPGDGRDDIRADGPRPGTGRRRTRSSRRSRASGCCPSCSPPKAAVVGLVVMTAVAGWQRHPLVTATAATVGVAAGLIGATSNVLVLLDPYRG